MVKPEGMSDKEWRRHLIEALGFEPRDCLWEVVVSDQAGAREVEVNQADGSTSIARRMGADVELEMSGPTPEHEDDVGQVLVVLARRLSSERMELQPKVKEEQDRETGVDGWLVGPRGVVVDVQVTRALADESLMLAVSRGTVLKTFSAGETADGLLQAARRKADPKKGSARARRTLVLALDAGRLPHNILPDVLKACVGLRSEFAALGFKAVFLVGKNHERTYRLDADAAFSLGSDTIS